MTATGFTDCIWLNEPEVWTCRDQILQVTTGKQTDFWRETHYNFIRDSGHFYAYHTSGDFTATLRVRAQYQELYDQAGLMVRLNEAEWLKAGIEISDGAPMMSSVLTVGKSDWATSAYTDSANDFRIRVTVASGVLRLQTSVDGERWSLARLCPFPPAAHYQVGPMCCTPERAGLHVTFSNFTVRPPLQKDLHDLTA